jgi:hypothetical protein
MLGTSGQIHRVVVVFASFLAMLSCASCASAQTTQHATQPATPAASLPPDSAYVTVDAAGHLSRGGVRVRYWGLQGKFPGTGWASKDKTLDPYVVNEATVARLKFLGFNMIRFWEAPDPDEPYVKGDRSNNDVIDHFIAECQRNGIAIWWAGFGGAVGRAMPEDVGIIDDPATADAWAQAVGSKGRQLGKKSLVSAWDPRAKAIRIRNLARLANHVNQHTGFRYADDPAIAVWELVNEDWWVFNMQRGQFLRLPPFFLAQLRGDWNAYLKRKYPTPEALARAWGNNLLAGESLADGTIALLPLPRHDVNDAQAVDLGVDVDDAVAPPVLDAAAFTESRGADVIEFLVTTVVNQKLAERDALKPLGKSLSLSPMVFDTGIGGDLPTQLVHARADAVVHSTYINGTMHPDPRHRRFPWYSALEEQPRLCWDKPWLENTKQPGKPFFVYENNIMQPAKYRAEHPIRLAALGLINDWDVVIFHYWGMPRDPRLPAPFDQPMDYTIPNHPTQGYHFQFDSVLQAGISAAARMFVGQAVEPVPNPSQITIGRRSLFSPKMIEYGQYQDVLMPTAWRYGLRVAIDPTQEDDRQSGTFRRRGVYEPNPVTPMPEISLDAQRGQIRIDAPAAATFCGFLGADQSATFASGVTFEDVAIANDPGIAYPVADDEKYALLSLTASDGKPLGQADEVTLYAASTSFNTGFQLDESRVTAEWFWPKGAIKSVGATPVLHARVGCVVRAPALSGRRFQVIDWHGRVVREGAVEADRFQLDPRDAAFKVVFTKP